MLKLFRLSAVLSTAAVVLSLPQTVFSRPLTGTSGYPVARTTRADSFFCYMRTSQGATLNLENLCTAEESSSSANGIPNVAPNPAATLPPTQTPPNSTPPAEAVVTIPSTSSGSVTPNGTPINPNTTPANTSANSPNINPAGTTLNTPNSAANTTTNNTNNP